MDIELAQTLVTINPYLMGALTVAVIGVCMVLGRLVFWLVKFVIHKHECEN
jgi:hypothetical protein